ncbi:hypothetical protein QYM36_011879 [Artemia franciscana]|uniref:Reverse transcriptase domain-containing protein n=1 Tax=Artemia franciscana TaxID=6661 RepID=A0AA88HFP6_ARTSF|nr:hypothetical protein QYM36_011879 [Artemia franciscana]
MPRDSASRFHVQNQADILDPSGCRKAQEFQCAAYIAFVNFKAAFDLVDHNFLWLILEQTGLLDKHYCLFKTLYTDNKGSIQINSRHNPVFEVNNSVRQGCTAAPKLQL